MIPNTFANITICGCCKFGLGCRGRTVLDLLDHESHTYLRSMPSKGILLLPRDTRGLLGSYFEVYHSSLPLISMARRC